MYLEIQIKLNFKDYRRLWGVATQATSDKGGNHKSFSFQIDVSYATLITIVKKTQNKYVMLTS